MPKTPSDSEPKKEMVPPDSVSVVACIPTYNEQETIGSVILKTLKYVDKVYVCDDGSTDMTVELSEALGVYVIRHEDRKGLSESLRDLLGASIQAKPDAIVILEGDNPLYPEYIPDFVQSIKNSDDDIVVGIMREHSPTVGKKNSVETIGGIEANDPDETPIIIQAFSLNAAIRFYDLETNILGDLADELSYAKKTGLSTKILPIEIENDTPPTTPEVESIHDANNVISEVPKPKMPEVESIHDANNVITETPKPRPSEILTIKKPLMVFGTHARVGIVALVVILAGAGLVLNSGILTRTTNNISTNYTLLIKTPEGSGSTIPATGNYSFIQRASTQVDATPAQGWKFERWVIDNSTSNSTNPITITMNGNETLRATFSQIQYTLTINTTGSGTTSPDMGVYTYGSNSTIHVTATPEAGWQLDHWTLDGAQAGSGEPCTVEMNSNHTLNAAFTQIQYKLEVNISGIGSVSRSPDSPTYLYGATVQLDAIPQQGWVFTGWSGDVSSSNRTIRLTLNGDKNVTAKFSQSSTPPPTSNYTLTIQVPQGEGSTSPENGIYDYASGSNATVTATASDGFQFDHWILDGSPSSSSNPLILTMLSNHTLEAVFTQAQSSPPPHCTLTVNVNPVAGGTITPNASPPYHYGDVVTLTESPSAGYTFSAWSGDGTGASTTHSVTITGNMAVTATFTQTEYTVSVTVSPSSGGTVSESPNQSTYHYGGVVTLTESPSAGYTFSAWSGDGTGIGSTRSVTVAGNMGVTATFTQITYTLMVATLGSGGGSVALSPTGGSYASGTVVTLTATPATGSSFTGWGGDLSGITNPTTVTMDSAKSVAANFTQITYTLTVSTAGSGTGSFSLSPSGGTYASGTVVTLTATPAANCTFTGWSGDLTDLANPATIIVNGDKAVTAIFDDNGP